MRKTGLYSITPRLFVIFCVMKVAYGLSDNRRQYSIRHFQLVIGRLVEHGVYPGSAFGGVFRLKLDKQFVEIRIKGLTQFYQGVKGWVLTTALDAAQILGADFYFLRQLFLCESSS